MYKYVLLRTTYEYRVYTLLQKVSTEGGQTHTERKNSVRMASQIGSKLAKISFES